MENNDESHLNEEEQIIEEEQNSIERVETNEAIENKVEGNISGSIVDSESLKTEQIEDNIPSQPVNAEITDEEIPPELERTVENEIESPQDSISEIKEESEDSIIPSAEELKGIKADEEKKWKDLHNYLEAVFFQLGKPITERELIDYFEKFERYKDADRITIRAGIRKVIKGLKEQQSSIILINPTKDFWSYQLDENLPDYFYEKVQKFLPKDDRFDFEESRILTEVAYRQPVKASEISKILGYSAMPNLEILEKKGLITMEKDKQTFICNTTEKFAEIYGFDSALRNLKIQLVWRLKKSMKSEMKKDKEALEMLERSRQQYEK